MDVFNNFYNYLFCDPAPLPYKNISNENCPWAPAHQGKVFIDDSDSNMKRELGDQRPEANKEYKL